MVNKRKTTLVVALIAAAAVIILAWRPTVLIYGLQAAGLYASIAVPMGLILGIVHIVNLAHGEFLMVAAYATYLLCKSLGIDPYLALLPVTAVTAGLGFVVYKLTIRQTLKAPELNQLILTFGLGISMTQIANLLFTSQTRKLSFDYVSASIDIGELSFGVYNFVFLGAALLMVVGLRWYLTRTTAGKAAVAVGQNPRGAAIVGIDVDRTYGFVFAMATALVGMMGAMLITRSAVFPTVGSPYTMKSFCLVAMAGIGNIPGILGASILLGVSENLLKAFRGLRGWADIVFFVLIITVILGRSIRGKKA
ncbi:MAG TPA: branched-chain amino acid ABC transporter permease [Spirochaetales bacterium]|nr:branched-chain amino acid ABC transporter permease [Spirochaetales bacterium]HPG85144.1 branched-chain amino acid ABC transporter permease [Spirochaetales bacterium]HQO65494.1 branched-chain amino acid ABC transporter permease [Spirochaetales bacterium]